MKKRLFFAVALLALLVAPAGVVAQEDGGTLVAAFDVGPGGCPKCIPFYNTAGNDWLIKIWSPLVSYNADVSSLAPQLAVAWETNADSTVWTFTLREGVVWHDGEPFSADDVIFTYDLATNPDAATLWAQNNAGNIARVSAVDARTVEFTLNEPDPRLPYKLIAFYIMPKHSLAAAPVDLQTADWWFANPVGTGPFMHDEYQVDQFWALKPNPNYWNGAPKLGRLINRYFEDETAAVLALEGGEINFTYVSGDVALRLQENPDLQIFSGPSGVVNYFIFNLRNPAFQDVRVRQAFLYAIDRQAIVDVVLQGTAQVAPCISAFPAMWPDEYNDYAYNPELARQLLEDAGWDFDASYEVVTYYSSQFHLDAMAAQQQYLADIGVKIVPVPQDVPTYNSYFYTGEGWDISYRGLGGNVGAWPWNYYLPDGFPEAGGSLHGQTFPELAELINAAKVESDPDRYMDLLQQICAFQSENVVEGYMWVSTRFGAASANLVDFYWFPAGGGGPYESHPELWAIAE